MNRNFIEFFRALLGIAVFASIFISAGVYAIGEPQVNTTVPGSIYSSSVILSGGSVDSVAGNETTIWGMQYGLATATYTNWTNTTGSMVLYPQNFTSILSPLIPADRYYFRSFVQGSGFINYGSEVSNMTLCDPLTTFVATPISPTSIFLSFAPSVVGSGSTAYNYIRYQEGAYPSIPTEGLLLCNTTLTSWTLSNLTFGHTYFFTGWQTAVHTGAFSGYSDPKFTAATPSYTSGVATTTPASWENYYYAANMTSGSSIWGPFWQYQTFTTGTIAHTVSLIKVNISRVGLPGNIIVSVKRVESGLPIGPDLCQGAIDGNLVAVNTTAWYSSTMTMEASLLANTQYAITMSAPSGTNLTDYIRWSYTTGTGYTGGVAGASVDNGYSWSANSLADSSFEIWGFPALEMQSARVFQSYATSGDWLIICHYRNVYPPYYPTADPKYFQLQFLNGNTVLAQSPCLSWDYRPGSIYIDAAAASLYTWGAGYKVRIINTIDTSVYSEYFLSPSCWVGSNPTLIDEYVISIARAMETYYSLSYTTPVIGLGQILNSQGGVYFSVGIPLLPTIRPNLFTIATTVPTPWVPAQGTQALQGTMDWEVAVGPYIANAFSEAGSVFGGVSGRNIGIMLVVIVYLLLAAFVTLAGQSGAAIFLAFPIFIMGAAIGLIPLAVMFVALAIASFLLVWHFWLGRA